MLNGKFVLGLEFDPSSGTKLTPNVNELEKLNTYHNTFNEPKKTSPLFRVTKSPEHTNTGGDTLDERHYSSQSLDNSSSARRFAQESDNNSYGGFHKPEMTAHELRRAKREVYENY